MLKPINLGNSSKIQEEKRETDCYPNPLERGGCIAHGYKASSAQNKNAPRAMEGWN